MNLDANSLKTILAIQGGNMNTKNTGGGTISLNKDYTGKSDINFDKSNLMNLSGTESIVQGGTYNIKNHGSGNFNTAIQSSGDQKATAQGDQSALMMIQGGLFNIENTGSGAMGLDVKHKGDAEIGTAFLVMMMWIFTKVTTDEWNFDA